MRAVDWAIVILVVAAMAAVLALTRKLTRSVADFLAAGRCGGRYIICISEGIAGLGAITLVGLFEVHYQAGFSALWWSMLMPVVAAAISLSGWVIYRYRQTRALTLGQFFELRYSKRFRVFAGILCFVSGVVNFGIFPAVGARFFLYFTGLPQHISLAGLAVPLFPLLMAVLLGIAIAILFGGGQVAVILTDFLQGVMVNVAFVALLILLLVRFSWPQIGEALLTAPEDASLVHPFRTRQVTDFNVWYFLIGAFGAFYTHMSWQGSQGYNASARNPHEARMAKILGTWRGLTQSVLVVMIPIGAYVVMHHPDFTAEALEVRGTLSAIDNEQIQEQMTVPVAARHFMPPGVMGLFCAVMLTAFVSTHNTYLHSWGSIFIQDVVLPFRKRPFAPDQHLRVLRWSIVGVALFIFLFSLFFRQTEYIYMFFAITGAIFTGGSGAVIIGGLYWKRGTTPAAWAAMITGATLAVTGIIVRQINPAFPVNAQVMWFIAMVVSITVYVAVSLSGGSVAYNMDRLLHRGRYAVASDSAVAAHRPAGRIARLLGMGDELTPGDKVIYVATIALFTVWGLVFFLGTAWNLAFDVPTASWLVFWKWFVLSGLVLGGVTTVWLTVGGVWDVRYMLAFLRTALRNDADDGMVLDGVSHEELERVSGADGETPRFPPD